MRFVLSPADTRVGATVYEFRGPVGVVREIGEGCDGSLLTDSKPGGDTGWVRSVHWRRRRARLGRGTLAVLRLPFFARVYRR
jgi:hypothetical protein